jgi:hypothetical protein
MRSYRGLGEIIKMKRFLGRKKFKKFFVVDS